MDKKKIFNIVMLAFMVLSIIICVPGNQNAEAVARVVKASGQGGSTYWTVDCFKEDLTAITSDIEIALYDDDWDEIFDDVAIDSGGGFHISELKASTEYYLVIYSEDHEYKSHVVNVKTPSSGNTSLPTVFIMEDYWETDSVSYFWSNSAGIFTAAVVILGAVVGIILLAKSRSFKRFVRKQ